MPEPRDSSKKAQKISGALALSITRIKTKVKAENTAFTVRLRFHLQFVFVGCRCIHFSLKKWLKIKKMSLPLPTRFG